MDALVRKVEKLAARGIPETGPLATAESERLRVELEQAIDGEPDSSSRQLAYGALGYLEGIAFLDDREHQDAVMGLLPPAMARWALLGHGRSGVGKPNPILGNCLFLLGREYVQYAQWKMSTELFVYATVASTNRTVARDAGLLSLISAAHEDDEMYSTVRDLFDDDTIASDRGLAAAVRALDGALGRTDIAHDVGTYSDIWTRGPLAAGLIVDRLAQTLNASGRYRDVVKLTYDALIRLGDDPILESTKSAVLQESSSAKLHLGNEEGAIADAEQSWELSEYLRYGNCDHRMREAAWARHEKARIVALRAAAAVADAEKMAGYIQRDRLRASLFTWLEPSDSEDEPQPTKADKVGRSGMTVNGEQKDDSRGDSSGMTAPEAFFAALGDTFNSTRLTPPPKSEEAVSSRDIPWWLGIARYDSALFWTILRNGIGIDCGTVDLDESNLGDLLLDLQADVTGNARPDGRDISVDPLHDLAEWGTFEERIATLTLGQLLPETLVAALHGASAEHPLSLVIAAGRGLDGVPWPIVQIATPDTGGFRLIERACIRHWLSSDVESARAGRPVSEDELPILVAIDDPEDNLAGRSAFLKANSLAYFSGESPIPNAKEAVKRALYDHCDDGALGVFFYRGHATSFDDPAHVAIAVPEATPGNVEESHISSGEFFGRFDGGERFLPLPSRVVLSCCSSSSGSLFGGEALGLAAACVRGGGAQEVIATGYDVIDCSFTSAFDDMLAGALVDPSPHDAVLRRLQVRMYDEWRTFSVRGGIELGDDIRFPHPLVWAMYQAM